MDGTIRTSFYPVRPNSPENRDERSGTNGRRSHISPTSNRAFIQGRNQGRHTDTPPETEQAALALAWHLNLQGQSVPRAGVTKYLTRKHPDLDAGQVLDRAITMNWLELSDDGSRVQPGRAYPQIVV
jgi:hypothetical protein